MSGHLNRQRGGLGEEGDEFNCQLDTQAADVSPRARSTDAQRHGCRMTTGTCPPPHLAGTVKMVSK